MEGTRMNKVSKLLMVLMMTGMLVSVDVGAKLATGEGECSSEGNSYWYDGKCHKCPKGYQWNDKSKRCLLDSAASTGSTSVGGTNVVECPAGTYQKYVQSKKNGPVNLKCFPCTGDTYSSKTNSQKCLSCPKGQKPNKDHTKCEIKCPENAVCSGNGQFSCNNGYYKSNSGKTCTKCPAGYGCSNNERKKCPAGQYAPAGSKDGCKTCSKGTYSSAGASKCKSCSAGKKPNKKHTACVKA